MQRYKGAKVQRSIARVPAAVQMSRESSCAHPDVPMDVGPAINSIASEPR